jgi:hypothetical protein
MRSHVQLNKSYILWTRGLQTFRCCSPHWLFICLSKAARNVNNVAYSKRKWISLTQKCTAGIHLKTDNICISHKTEFTFLSVRTVLKYLFVTTGILIVSLNFTRFEQYTFFILMLRAYFHKVVLLQLISSHHLPSRLDNVCVCTRARFSVAKNICLSCTR